MAPQARGRQAEPARGAEGAWLSDQDWDAVPDLLGSEVLHLVVELYGWLSWASLGTTRGMRNRRFDAVLLRRDGGTPEGVGDPGGPREGPPDRDLGRVAKQGANVAEFRGGGGSAPHHGRGGQQRPLRGPCGPPPPTGATAGQTHRRRNPSPHTSGGACDGRARRRWSQAIGTSGWGRTSAASRRDRDPDPERTAHPPRCMAQRRGARRLQ